MPPADYDADDRRRISEDLRNQVSSTISEIAQKPIQDADSIYFRVDLAIDIRHPSARAALDALSARVVTYLNGSQTRLLVSADRNAIEKFKPNAASRKAIRLIRPLKVSEQIFHKKSTRSNDERDFLIFVVPTDETQKRREYALQIHRYLSDHSREGTISHSKYEGLLTVHAKLSQIENLVKNSNTVFKVEESPRAISSETHKLKTLRAKARLVKKPMTAQISNFSETHSPLEDLPAVVVMDSGVNDITQLRRILTTRTKFAQISSVDDDSVDATGAPISHGTPMAHLVAYGENGIEPRARIISHKVWSSREPNFAYSGILDALDRHRDKSRLFVSSVNFIDEEATATYALIDKVIQEQNAIVAFSAGNISREDLLLTLNNGKAYPNYLKDYPVQHPARGVSITAVGSVAHHPSDLAAIGSPSPFTTCGVGPSQPHLHYCQKPEVVEHGGNLDSQCQTVSPGVASVDRNGSPAYFYGTSFASPLYIGRLAELFKIYSKDIVNAETYKAITLIGCNPRPQNCIGYGEPQSFSACDKSSCLWVFEGTISLPEIIGDKEGGKFRNIPADILSVEVPPNIHRIRLCLVHSDDYARFEFPHLNTYFTVTAVKTSTGTKQPPDIDPTRKLETHVKFYSWKYKSRSMGGTWEFKITPHSTVYILPEERKEIKIRYGCAILLEADGSMLGDNRTVTEWCRARIGLG